MTSYTIRHTELMCTYKQIFVLDSINLILIGANYQILYLHFHRDVREFHFDFEHHRQ